jgi:surfeit locus 1 family protein
MNNPDPQSQRAPARRRWLVALATVVVMAVTASLGVWQLSRASQKRALEAMIDSRAALTVWTEHDLAAPAALPDGMHRRARLAGVWDPAHTVFLDNRPMNGHSGFIVVTPLRLRGLSQAILVQRGWVPRDFTDRTRVPAISTPEGEVSIEGRLAPPPSHLFELGQAQPGRIRQNVDLEAFARETGLQLVNASLLQTAPPSTELVRDWPRFAAGVQKHYGYAFQWFAMCATAAGLFLWFQIISPRRKLRSHGTEHR